MPSTEGVAARRAALQMLDAVLRRGRTLDSAAAAVKGLPGPDLGLAIAIAGEVLRRIPDLDTLIDSATRKPLPDDSKARLVLRMALAQKLGLQTPDHAIVATALPLVDGGPRRLVHGVLGTLLRRGISSAQSLRLPDQVEERWREAWGETAVEAARRQIAARPALDLTFKSDEAAEAFAAEQGGTSLARRHVRLGDSGVITELPGFESGSWWVQDLAASLPARLVPPKAKEILDLCSAPGGKAMQLAAAGQEVTAVDNSDRRLDRLRENLARTELNAKLVCADVLKWTPQAQFDAILLDAPCSATGTFRRHPEVLYRARPQIIADSADLQAKLLARASQWLKPGGALVYAVCSMEPEEGESIIRDFLAGNSGFTISPPKHGDLPDFAKPTSEGWVRIIPGTLEDEGGLDGFFIARLVRSG
jgi:16S rRNA (cytosine967-C5)-methyltransferase